MKTSLEQRANARRVAFMLGAIDPSHIVSWADSEIESMASPPIALIDLSMGGKLPAPNIISLLAELASNQKNDVWSTQMGLSMLGEKARCKNTNIQQLAMECQGLLKFEGLLYDNAFLDFITFETDVSLIRDGIFGVDHIPLMREKMVESFDAMARETQNAG